MKKLLKKYILYLIKLLEKIELRQYSLDENNDSLKIIETVNLKGIEVITDKGFKEVKNIHKTQPYKIWNLETHNGKKLKCADNHKIFDEHMNEIFVKDLCANDIIQTEDGLDLVKRVYPEKYSVSMVDLTINDKNHRYYTDGILSHNTISSSIFIAWYLLFNFDKNALILSNKGDTTREIVDKTKIILENLPFFMKPGILKNDVFNMKFDNGCRIVAQATTKNAGIGFTIHMLFLDEFAHIHPNFVNSFYENAYPTLSSSKVSRIIITSTPNGFNKFHSIYEGAVNNTNAFKAIRIDWWQVPGRDEKWMKAEIGNLGGEDAFNRQYGNQFVSGDNLLLGPSEIKLLEEHSVDFITHEFEDLDDLEIKYKQFLSWHPDFNTDYTQDPNSYYVFSIDIAAGNFGDYSVINMFKIVPLKNNEYKYLKQPGSFQNFFKFDQIGLFNSNEHNIEELAKILYTLVYLIFNSENVKLVIEWNAFGGELLKSLETIFPQRNDFDEENIVKFKHRKDARAAQFGLKIKNDNKVVICLNFKRLISEHRISIYEKNTVRESKEFAKTASGSSYKGSKSHDDLIMSSINVSEFFSTIDYSDFVEELFDLISSEEQKEINEEIEKYTTEEGTLYYDIYSLV